MAKRTAILLEDDAQVRAALHLLLSDLGWSPVAAQSAGEALAQLPALDAVGAIITDFNLGVGINGVDEAGTLIRAGVSAPVLVMSSSTHGQAQNAARSAGHAYLDKPVRADRVEAWLAALG